MARSISSPTNSLQKTQQSQEEEEEEEPRYEGVPNAVLRSIQQSQKQGETRYEGNKQQSEIEEPRYEGVAVLRRRLSSEGSDYSGVRPVHVNNAKKRSSSRGKNISLIRAEWMAWLKLDILFGRFPQTSEMLL